MEEHPRYAIKRKMNHNWLGGGGISDSLKARLMMKQSNSRTI